MYLIMHFEKKKKNYRISQSLETHFENKYFKTDRQRKNIYNNLPSKHFLQCQKYF